jgi:hypothetical protein
MANQKSRSRRIINRILFAFSSGSRTIKYYNLIKRPIACFSLKRDIRKSSPRPYFIGFNSDVERSVEVLETDVKLEQAIITCYFTKKADPIRGVIRQTPDIKYIEPWYKSVISQKLNGIIIHDGINKDFIEEYQNQFVQFREYKPGHYSIFEERWFAYYLFLSATKIRKVFFTDISDVMITANPIEIIDNPFTLFIGRDHANKIGISTWALSELNNFMEDSKYKAPKSFYFQQVYNVGIAGGSRHLILFFIARMLDLILLTTTDRFKDMTVANLVIHKYFFPKLKNRPFESATTRVEDDAHISHKYLVSGFPLNSEFGKYEMNSRAIFIHK